jgi:gamma-D-glutamyl-L-lysine dipeptidyl-peptidase
MSLLGAALVCAPAVCGSTAVVSQPVVNMYSGPSDDRDVVSQAILGMNVSVVEESTEWLRIRTPDEYLGWVPVSAVNRTSHPYAAEARVAQVANLYAHLYRERSVTKHAPALTVPFETRLEVVNEANEEEGKWIEVRLPDDRHLWVQRGDVSFDPKPLSVRATISLSKQFLGLPYTWGGTSSFGYDCSGFTQMLCRRRGISMPRDAQPQADWQGFTVVTKSRKLKPGDLLFFGQSPARITHTGLYIGGHKFIHSTARDNPVIQISKLDSHWKELLVAMRRPK